MAYPAELTWEDMMEDTERTVKALDAIYGRCIHVAAAIKGGLNDNFADLERLLNQTVPVTEADRRLAFSMVFLAGIKRGALIEYLFKVRRACLLLLIDGGAAATALGVENDLDVWIDADGTFKVARLADRARGAAGGRPAAASEGRSHRGGQSRGARRDRARQRDAAAGGRAPAAKPARGSATGKPVMDMSTCFQVIAALDAGEPLALVADPNTPADAPAPASAPAPAPAPTSVEAPYLAAVTRGPAEVPLAAAELAAKPAPAEPDAAAEPDAGAVGAEPAAEPDTGAAAVEPDATVPEPTAKPAAANFNWADDVEDDSFLSLPVAADPKPDCHRDPQARRAWGSVPEGQPLAPGVRIIPRPAGARSYASTVTTPGRTHPNTGRDSRDRAPAGRRGENGNRRL